MTGGLLQLVAYGAQDVYLTGNPQITFFKVVYRRHTNFAMESIQQTFNGNVGAGKRVTAQISRNGDLIHKMYVVANVKGIATSKSIGHNMLKKVELEIGGQLIDRQYSEWMYIWNELSMTSGKKDGFYEMVAGDKTGTDDTTSGVDVYVPLEFWFCRNIGLALPLIALQYHEVKVNIEFASTSELVVNSADLWVDYVFLDTDERRRFAQLSHEYLIEQVQHTGAESASSKLKLNFNHPVKELVWFIRNDSANNTLSNWANFENGFTSAKLQLNGNDRFAARDAKYFTHVQPFQHHENIPVGKNINVYSFAVKPEEHQPSGTLNMSRIDTATLNLVGANTAHNAYVYAVNYNVLRILSGMGGLAYSN
jgi:hypothetical protein